jgi:hypothetical protein
MVMLRKLISLHILIIVKSDVSNGKDCDIDDDIVKKTARPAYIKTQL